MFDEEGWFNQNPYSWAAWRDKICNITPNVVAWAPYYIDHGGKNKIVKYLLMNDFRILNKLRRKR